MWAPILNVDPCGPLDATIYNWLCFLLSKCIICHWLCFFSVNHVNHINQMVWFGLVLFLPNYITYKKIITYSIINNISKSDNKAHYNK